MVPPFAGPEMDVRTIAPGSVLRSSAGYQMERLSNAGTWNAENAIRRRSNLLGCGMVRQHQSNRSSFGRPGEQRKFALVSLDDAADDGESQPGACAFR